MKAKAPVIAKNSYSDQYLSLIKQGYEIDPVTFMEMKNGQPIGDGFVSGQAALPHLKEVFKYYMPYKLRQEAYENRKLLKRIANG
jgi:hypothetical protein